MILVSSTTHASSLTLEETVKDLDPSVGTVFMCGNWKHNSETGSYRIIFGDLWGHTEIYVQWVAGPIYYPEKGQKERRTPLVIKTASFPEYNAYESATDLSNIDCLERNKKWIITADADNSHEKDPKKSKYRLTIHLYNEPGKFRIEER